MDLDELLERIKTKDDFIQFTKKLRDDKVLDDKEEKTNPSSPYGPSIRGWENNSIAHFLDSVVAFGKASDEIQEEATWKSFALLLYAGKFYE